MPTVLLYNLYKDNQDYNYNNKIDISTFELESLEKLANEQDEFF